MKLLYRQAIVVSFGPSSVPERLARLGWNVASASPEWWLMPGREATDRLIVVDWAAELPRNLAHALRRHAADHNQPELWVAAKPPLWLLDTEAAPFPLVLDPGCDDLHWAWNLDHSCALAACLDESIRAQQRLELWEEAVRMLPVGVFRMFSPHNDTYYLSAWSQRAQELTGWSHVAALATGRGPSLTTLIRQWDQPPGTRSHTETFEVAGRQRTLRFVAEVRVEPSTQVWSCSGAIRDVSDEPLAHRAGERAVVFLQEVRMRLDQLDLGDHQASRSDSGLSDRESDVYQLIRAGLSNAQIALRLGISESAVKKHVSAVFDKKGVNTRAQLLTLS